MSTLPAPGYPDIRHTHIRRLRFYWVNRGAPNQGAGVDLALDAWGLIARKEGSYGNQHFYEVTPAGMAVLHAAQEEDLRRRAPHHELAGRLAQWLQGKGRMTWEGVEFTVREQDMTARARHYGIDATSQRGILFALPRPDVFSLVPTHTEARINPIVHEVKVSRADFLADVAKPLKRLAYACIAESVYYAAPEGLLRPEEMPPACGLVVESAAGDFKLVKRARKQRVTLTPSHYMNLVMKPGAGPPR